MTDRDQLDLEEDWEVLPDGEISEIPPSKFIENAIAENEAAMMISEDDDLQIKLESPRSTRGILDQFGGDFQVDIMGDADQSGEGNQDFNLWKWGSPAISAICSLAMAAVAVSVVIFTAGNGRNKQGKNQVLHYPNKTHTALSLGDQYAAAST